MTLFGFTTGDADLVRDALRDRARAFEKLVHRYQKKAHAVARANGIPVDLLDDVVQEAFLRAFRKLPSLREPGRFGPWFLAIVRNLARSHAVARNAERAARMDGTEEAGTAPDDPLEVGEIRERLWSKVSELPAGIREAIFLYYQDGARTRQVARALGISTGAVKARLHKGRMLLRESLWRELDGELTDLLPSARDWRRTGRALTLLVVSTVTADWLARGKVAAALVAPGVATSSTAAATTWALDSSWAGSTLLGGSLMTGKKLIIAASLSLAILLGGTGVLFFTLPPNDPSATPKGPASLSPGRATSTVASGGTAPEVLIETASKIDAVATDTTPVPAPLSGRVLDPRARGVEGARVIALELTAWNSIGERYRSASLSLDELRELYGAFEARTETATDTGGGFRFDTLADGHYQVVIQHDDFLVHTEDEVAVVRQGSQPLDVTLQPAQPIRGRVVDSTGAPIEDAVVRATATGSAAPPSIEQVLRTLERWERGLVLFETPSRSGANGRFTLPSLEPGTYDLAVSKSGFAPTLLRHVSAPREDLVVTLDGGYRLTGRVVIGASRRPAAGARVEIAAARPLEIATLRASSAGEPPPAVIASTTTAADGRFTLASLPRGSFVLAVSAAGHPAAERAVALGEEDGSAGAAPNGRTPVREEDLGDIELELPQRIAGTVMSRDGIPISGVRIWIHSDALAAWLPEATEEDAAHRVESDASGRFIIEPLRRGDHLLRFSSPDWVDTRRERVPSGTLDLEVVLDRGHRIRGRVVDERGEAVSGAQVSYESVRTVSGDDGRFDLRGIPLALSGEHILEASQRQHGSASVRINVPRPEDEEVELRLGHGNSIHGVVTDRDGEPISGATVRLDTRWASGSALVAGTIRWDTTDQDGAFRLAGSAEQLSGALRKSFVVARHRRYAASFAGPLRPPGSGEHWADVHLILDPGGVIEGVVRGTGGSGVPGALVTARAVLPRGSGFHKALLAPGRRTWTDSDGRYRLERVSPAPVEIRVLAPGFAPETVEDVDMAEGGMRTVGIELDRGDSLAGLVSDVEGGPFPGAEVSLYRLEDGVNLADAQLEELHRKGGAVTTAVTDAAGAYALPHLPGGSYVLVARASGFAPARTEALDSRAGDVPTLVLERHGAVGGRVLEASSRRPIQSFRIEVVAREPGEEEDRRDATTRLYGYGGSEPGRVGSVDYRVFEGRFLFDGLRAGHYVVRCRSRGFLEKSVRVTLAAGEVAPVEFVMERGASVRGHVVSSVDGTPVVGANVALYPEGSPMPVEVRSGADGAFLHEGLRAGKASIRVFHSFFRLDGHEELTLLAGKTIETRLTMEPAGSYRIRLVNLPKGGERDGVQLQYYHMATIDRILPGGSGGGERRKRIMSTIVHEDATIGLGALAPGRYAARILRKTVTAATESDGQVGVRDVGGHDVVTEFEVEIVAGERGYLEVELPE